MVCSIGSQANELELCIYLEFPENIQAYQWFIWGWGRGGGDKGEHSSPPLKFISLPLKTYTILVSRHTDLLQQVYFDKTKNKKKTKKKTHTTVQVTICCSKNDVTPNYVLATHRMGCNTFHQLFMGFSTYFMYVHRCAYKYVVLPKQSLLTRYIHRCTPPFLHRAMQTRTL